MKTRDIALLGGAGLVAYFLLFKKQDTSPSASSPGLLDALNPLSPYFLNPTGVAQGVAAGAARGVVSGAGNALQQDISGLQNWLSGTAFNVREAYNVWQAPTAAANFQGLIQQANQAGGTAQFQVQSIGSGSATYAYATGGATAANQAVIENAVRQAGVQYGYTPATGGAVVYNTGTPAAGTVAQQQNIASRLARGLI